MRLSEIRKIILENIEKLSYGVSGAPNHPGHVSIVNIPPVIDAIEKLSQLKFLNTSIVKLKSYNNIYTARTPSIITPNADNEAFQRLLTEFKEQCNNIIALANEVTPPIEEETISIKLLETANIGDIKKLVVALDEITSQISNLPDIEGTVRFAGFESGTDWIIISITGTALAKFLNLIIEGAYSVANCYIAIKTAKQKCSGIEKANEAIGDVGVLLKALCQSEVEKIQNNNNYEFDPENIIRISNVMKGMVGVIADGNTVVPSLKAPIETQNKIENSSKYITNQLQNLNLLASPESVPEQVPANDEPIE